MIKKIVLLFFVFCISALKSSALNVIQENVVLRKQLNAQSYKQQKENKKQILYYKGISSYSGIIRTIGGAYSTKNVSNEKNIYEKKGVKFKIDTKKQEEKLKEIQEQEKDIKSITPVEVEKPVVENKKTENKSFSKSANHNDDAE